MNIVEEYKKLISNPMNKESFSYFLGIAQELSKQFEKSRGDNFKREAINGRTKTEYNQQYEFEIAFLTVFSHKYMNMINDSKTPIEMQRISKRDCPAHYNHSSGKITYDITQIIEDKSQIFANIPELTFHENRHTQQFKSFETDSIRELLKFDTNSIFILKDYILMASNGQQFYNRNHINSLMKTDANLYAQALSQQLIKTHFPEHEDDLKRTVFALIIDKRGNPFDELDTTGVIGGQYITDDGKKIDRAIMLDKKLKSIISPEIVAQFPMLNLIWQDEKFKSYADIIEDRTNYLQQCANSKRKGIESSDEYEEIELTDSEKIARIYDSIIRSDPMLYLEDLLSRKQIQPSKVIGLFEQHPSLAQEYSAEIVDIFTRKSSEIGKNQETILQDLAEKLNITIPNSMIQSGVEAGIEANTTTSQINGQTQTIREQEQINQLLEELGDCVEFLDTNQMQDRMYLEILKRHRDFYDDPYDAVAIADSEYERICKKENSDKVEETDETEFIDK